MAIPVFNPAIEVRLFKMVARRHGVAERYAAAKRDIDLTPLLGDTGAVRTMKDIGEPAGGFTVAFGDRLSGAAQDSLAAFIEPMDLIEIRAAREPHRYAGATLPLLMRGWVSSVQRTETMTADGTPQRTVVVQGQDSGKLWLIHQVIWELAYLQEVPFLDLFRLQAATGIEAAMLPVAEFMRQLTTRVVNPKVERLNAFAERQVRPFAVDATVPEGVVSITAVAPFQGPLWDLVEQMADRPWNEAFIEDRGAPGEEVPTVVFRPAPYRDRDGRLILPGAAEPGRIDLDISAVASIEAGRSDQRVANFFWVPPGATMLDLNQFVNVGSLQAGDPLDFEHGNNHPKLFGVRKMTVPTRLLPDLPGGRAPRDMSEGERQQASDHVTLWHLRRAKQLRDMNRDNTVLSEGGMVVRGSEELKPGRYLRLTRGDLISEHYITRVAHSITPLQGWTTQLGTERGTDFLERNKMAGSPYLAEGFRGPYG